MIDQGAQIHNVLVITQQKQEKRTKCLFFHPGQLDMCGKASNDAKCSFMLKVRSWWTSKRAMKQCSLIGNQWDIRKRKFARWYSLAGHEYVNTMWHVLYKCQYGMRRMTHTHTHIWTYSWFAYILTANRFLATGLKAFVCRIFRVIYKAVVENAPRREHKSSPACFIHHLLVKLHKHEDIYILIQCAEDNFIAKWQLLSFGN